MEDKRWPRKSTLGGDARPIDPKEFLFVAQLASSAASLDMPITNPEEYEVILEVGRGREVGMRFNDNPTSRASVAAREHFGERREACMSFLLRFFAMRDLRGTEAWQSPWVIEKPGELEINDAVFAVAATQPLEHNLRFNVPAFVERMREWDSENPGGLSD